MAAWNPSRGFPAFQDAMMAVYVLLHCLLAAASGRSQLSSSQNQAVLAWGHTQLSRIQEWVRNLQWTGLHKGCVALSGDEASIVAFQHIASDTIVRDMIDPLLALCSVSLHGDQLVTEALVSSIEHAWHAAQLVYPRVAERSAGFVWSSGLDRIDARFKELRTAIQVAGRS